MLLEEKQTASAFLAGHESFAAAEGAIGIAEKANKVRQKPLRVILNGLGKDAAYIIARINGFTYVKTENLTIYTTELKSKYSEKHTQDFVQKLTATALTMFAKVLLSCSMKKCRCIYHR